MKNLVVLKLSSKPREQAVEFERRFFHMSADISTSDFLRLYEGCAVRLGAQRGVENTVYIYDIQALRPSQGHGTKALEGLCALADELGVTLTLYADARLDQPRAQSRLSAWYTRHGFKRGAQGLFKRNPR